MKHNTHIYLASKAIELSRQSVDNLHDGRGKHVRRTKKSEERRAATHHQRILQYYQDMIEEATWVPDDVLRDNDPFHIFKLFTDQEFPNHGLTNKLKIESDGVTYYKFGGGLPYRVDHMTRSIVNMSKLRTFNDQFAMRQLMYQYLLMSHYVVDAHVPMHCDLRDDPPSQGGYTNPSRRGGTNKPRGKYMKCNAHDKLEQQWDRAVTPVALKEEVFLKTWEKESEAENELSECVKFSFKDCLKGGDIDVVMISENGLMDFMIDVCVQSKKRCQRLFPIDNPTVMKDDILKGITREVFSDCIGNLLSIWRYIWAHQSE